MKPVPIPEHWTAEEALGIVAFLEGIVEAIWFVHGRQMGYHLRDKSPPVDPPDPIRHPNFGDDTIPF